MQRPDLVSWPDSKRVALSLSFDDARYSQLALGIPVLDKHDVKATFYVSIQPMKEKAAEWKAVAANGHEIGNHTVKFQAVVKALVDQGKSVLPLGKSTIQGFGRASPRSHRGHGLYKELSDLLGLTVWAPSRPPRRGGHVGNPERAFDVSHQDASIGSFNGS